MSFFFGGMPGMGGMGGMGGHSHSHTRVEVETTKYYELLGVPKEADTNEIKKAFRKAAMIHHPDKGGDIEKFKEISKAHEVLSDPEKRAIYDEHGEEGLENGGGGGGAADIFEMFGMGGGGRGGPRRKTKGDDVPFPLKVTLEDMYNAATKKLRLTKNVLCKACKGKGGSNVTPCGPCKGQGVRLAVRQIGPGMLQQMQVPCNPCQGTGEIIQDKCKKCKGEKLLKEKKTLEVEIIKGMRKGQHIVFTGEADEEPGKETGDIVVILDEKEHDIFTRKGDHLFVKKTITLVEALCGFEITIDHLDNRRIKIKSEGAVIRPGDFRVIRDEGMPMFGKPTQHGHLYVEFDVTFPTPQQLDAKAKAELRKILPAPAPQPAAMDETKEGEEEEEEEEQGDEDEGKVKKPKKRRVVEGAMTNVDMTKERKAHEQQQREYLEEREEERERERERRRGGGGGGPQGVSCQQQ